MTEVPKEWNGTPEEWNAVVEAFGRIAKAIQKAGRQIVNSFLRQQSIRDRKKQVGIECSFFMSGIEVDEVVLDKAKERFRMFNNERDE